MSKNLFLRRGITLVEMLVVVAVLGIILAMAAPSMADLMARRRVEMVAAELATNLAYARSEAGMRPNPVLVYFGGDASGSCYTVAYWGIAGPCDCTRGAGNACTIPGSTMTEFKTVKVPSSTGVSLVASATKLKFNAPQMTGRFHAHDHGEQQSRGAAETQRECRRPGGQLQPQWLHHGSGAMLKLASRRSQLGLSLVEAMVGITVGLIVVAGATLLVTTQITDHRRLMTETQMQQDLRAAADLILHEVRRAGSWEQASNAVWAPAASAPASNPYAEMTPSAASAAASSLEIRVSKAVRDSSASSAKEDNAVTADEIRTFSLADQTLYYRMSSLAAPQPLTDPNSMLITAFNVNMEVQTVPLDSFCTVPCAAGSTTCPPQQEVRHVTVSITGQSKHDAALVRNVQLSTRLRNDRVVGTCP